MGRERSNEAVGVMMDETGAKLMLKQRAMVPMPRKEEAGTVDEAVRTSLREQSRQGII